MSHTTNTLTTLAAGLASCVVNKEGKGQFLVADKHKILNSYVDENLPFLRRIFSNFKKNNTKRHQQKVHDHDDDLVGSKGDLSSKRGSSSSGVGHYCSYYYTASSFLF